MDRQANRGRAREFKALQIESHNGLLEGEPWGPPAGLERPNITRCNSHHYAFKMAVLHRVLIDAYSEGERSHNAHLEQITQTTNG